MPHPPRCAGTGRRFSKNVPVSLTMSSETSGPGPAGSAPARRGCQGSARSGSNPGRNPARPGRRLAPGFCDRADLRAHCAPIIIGAMPSHRNMPASPLAAHRHYGLGACAPSQNMLVRLYDICISCVPIDRHRHAEDLFSIFRPVSGRQDCKPSIYPSFFQRVYSLCVARFELSRALRAPRSAT